MAALLKCLSIFILTLALLIGYLLIPRHGPPSFKTPIDLTPYKGLNEMRKAEHFAKFNLPAQKTLTNKKCVVTGANGFLGGNLVERLLMKGWEVYAMVRKGSNIDVLKEVENNKKKNPSEYPGTLQYVYGDINDYKSLLAAIPERVGVVFHVAALLSTFSQDNDQMYQSNVIGTRNVVNACLEKKVEKLVHTSSVAVFFGARPSLNITEDSEYVMDSYHGYHYTKLLAEYEIKLGIKKGQWATIINPCAILGKYDTTGFARIAFMLRDKEMPGSGNATLSFTRAKECADIHIAAAEKGKLGENYLVGNQRFFFKQLVDEVGRLINIDTSKIFVIPYPVGKILAEGEELISKLLRIRLPLSPETLDVSFLDCGHISNKAITELKYDDRVSFPVVVEESVKWLLDSKRLVLKK